MEITKTQASYTIGKDTKTTICYNRLEASLSSRILYNPEIVIQNIEDIQKIESEVEERITELGEIQKTLFFIKKELPSLIKTTTLKIGIPPELKVFIDITINNGCTLTELIKRVKEVFINTKENPLYLKPIREYYHSIWPKDEDGITREKVHFIKDCKQQNLSLTKCFSIMRNKVMKNSEPFQDGKIIRPSVLKILYNNIEIE